MHIINFGSTAHFLTSPCNISRNKNYYVFPSKILQSDWLRAFWPVSQAQDFSKIWNLSKNTANYINFHHRTNSVKINN